MGRRIPDSDLKRAVEGGLLDYMSSKKYEREDALELCEKATSGEELRKGLDAIAVSGSRVDKLSFTLTTPDSEPDEQPTALDRPIVRSQTDRNYWKIVSEKGTVEYLSGFPNDKEKMRVIDGDEPKLINLDDYPAFQNESYEMSAIRAYKDMDLGAIQEVTGKTFSDRTVTVSIEPDGRAKVVFESGGRGSIDFLRNTVLEDVEGSVENIAIELAPLK